MESSKKVVYGGKYERLDKIGSGTQAIAYLVRRITDGELLVAKVNKDDSTFEIAKKEASRLASYNSRYIVKHVDSFPQDTDIGEVFIIITEYCSAGDLEQFVKNHGGKKENMPLYVKVIHSILLGVNVLHQTRQVHRDIALKNIFLCGDVKDLKNLIAKLGDFGLARDVNSSKLTQLTFGGSPIYMSPEILASQGDDRAIGGMPSDMWAVGVCFHMLLSETGASPWGGFIAQVKGEFTKLPSYVPEDLSKVVSKLLEVDPLTRMTC